jgi:glycerophosphoryl diester phosphodiesterase
MAPGNVENGLSAFRAAIRHGYGIEMDIQQSRDGEAIVFHDDTLERLTDEVGPVREKSSAELSQMTLKNSADLIPTLPEVLSVVNGQVPLLIEVKDQDGALGPDVGTLEARIAELLEGYSGPAAVMSFNPHSVEAASRAIPDRPVGWVSCGFSPDSWATLPNERREDLASLAFASSDTVDFISHNWRDLGQSRPWRISQFCVGPFEAKKKRKKLEKSPTTSLSKDTLPQSIRID